MIPLPRRIHVDLPDGLVWFITRHQGRMVILLDAAIPPDSPLEQHFVRMAVRAWRREHGRLLALPLIAGAGAGWVARQLRRPQIAAVAGAAAATGVIFAAAQLGPDHPIHRPPGAAAPPAWSAAPSPEERPPPTPAAPGPDVTPTVRPETATPTVGEARPKPSRSGHVGAEGGPPETPPRQDSPPPGKPAPRKSCTLITAGGRHVPLTLSGGRLLQLQVGRLVRVCV